MEGLPVSVANYIIENEKIQLKEIYERKKLILGVKIGRILWQTFHKYVAYF